MIRSFQFGWGAASFSKQLPELTSEDAVLFDDFNKAIIKLSIHGIITETEKTKALNRATKKIEQALKKVK